MFAPYTMEKSLLINLLKDWVIEEVKLYILLYTRLKNREIPQKT